MFSRGKHKALTMSYDDGKHEDRRLVGIFNKYNIKGTFNLNSGLEGDPVRIPQAEYRELYKGHEVACHTVSHPTIARCPLAAVAQEIIEDRKRLEEIMGYPVRGLAYPNGSYSKEICGLLPGLGIRYGRIVGNSTILRSRRIAVEGDPPPQPQADGAGTAVCRTKEEAVSVPDVCVGAQL